MNYITNLLSIRLTGFLRRNQFIQEKNCRNFENHKNKYFIRNTNNTITNDWDF